MTEKKVILVIDDDPDILEAVKAILTSEGFEVPTSTSAKQGLKFADKTKPDVILCDMMMESVDAGITFAHDFKNKYPDVPIYLMSSIDEETAAHIEIDRLGFKGVLQKPIDPVFLISTIKGSLKI